MAECCRKPGDEGGLPRSRAVTVRSIAKDLFDIGANEPYVHALDAVRAALFVRGCGDLFGKFLGDRLATSPAASFRVHTFFRSIEGLYAPAGPVIEVPTGALARHVPIRVNGLSIDQADRDDALGSETDVSERLFELVYCECCGEPPGDPR